MKLACVVPRYGGEYESGPEHACRLLAEHLAQRHDVEVLTSCAQDASTWKNTLNEGADRVRGVLVRRFAVSQLHDPDAFAAISERLAWRTPSRNDSLEWARLRGPWSPGLIEHLKRQRDTYDAVVFFSLMHATTVYGLPVVGPRSVLFPHLQFTSTLRFRIWRELLEQAGSVGYMSATEQVLAERYVGALPRRDAIVGIGVGTTARFTYPRHQQDPDDAVVDDAVFSSPLDDRSEEYLSGRGIAFRRKSRLYGSVAMFVGRVEPRTSFEEMLEYFEYFSAAHSDANTSLEVIGPKLMTIPRAARLQSGGTLAERHRMMAYEAADVAVVPAPDDLLNLPVLESMAAGTPVLASAQNGAAVEHCRRGHAGLYYRNREEFSGALKLLIDSADLRQALGENGQRYVQEQYRWEAVIGRFERLVSPFALRESPKATMRVGARAAPGEKGRHL